MKGPVFLGAIGLSLALWSTAGATTVFSTDLAGGIAGWATSGNVDANQGTLRLRGPASAPRAVSTAGYSAVSVAFTMSAGSLENGEFCHTAVSTDGSARWIAVLAPGNGQDTGSTPPASAPPGRISTQPTLLTPTRAHDAPPGPHFHL